MEYKENRDKSVENANSDKRILIYDDNQEILTMCTMFLKKYHYQVKTMSRCEGVLSDVDGYQPDFILMDLWIPEIGGEKAVELLKGNPETSQIPVLLFSANSDIKEICNRVNADGYISKPFNLIAFKETIEKHIHIARNKAKEE